MNPGKKKKNVGADGEPVAAMSRARAEQFGAMIAVHLEYDRREHCGRVLARAFAEIERGSDLEDPAVGEPREVPIAAIGLPVRTVNRLEEAGLWTCQQVIDATDPQLEALSNLGRTTVGEIRRTLHAAFGAPLDPRWQPKQEPAAPPEAESVARLGLDRAQVAALEERGVLDCAAFDFATDDELLGIRGQDRGTIERARAKWRELFAAAPPEAAMPDPLAGDGEADRHAGNGEARATAAGV